jgi:enterochelin esterase family protein
LPTLITATICSLGGATSSWSDQLDVQSPALKRLMTQLQAGTPDAEAAFFAGLTAGTPLVEPSASADPAWSLVTFLWRGKADTRRVTVMGGRPVTDWEAPLEKLPGTDIWYRTQALPSDSRFVYTLTVDGRGEAPDRIEELLAEEDRSQPDPLNSRRVNDQSYVVLSRARPFPYPPNHRAPRGRLVEESVSSKVLGADIELRVYLPAKSGGAGAPWLVVAFDAGFEDMGTVLDDLIASGKIPPMVVVGVGNRAGMRVKDLGYSPEFARFIAEELILWARRRHHTSESRTETIVAGYSRGAGMAAYVGLQHPDRVGKVLAISTALENVPGGFPPARFWLDPQNGWLIERFIEAPRKELEFYIAAGRFDTSLWTDRLVNNRRFRDVLRAKGYRVRYAESNAGHDLLFFQEAYADGLAKLTSGGR